MKNNMKKGLAYLIAIFMLAGFVNIFTNKLSKNEKQDSQWDVRWFALTVGNNSKKTEKKSVSPKAVAVAKVENKGMAFTKDQLLSDSVFQQLYVVDGKTYVGTNEFDLYDLATMDLKLKQNAKKPQILIYHTHSQEQFADSDKTGKSILDVGDVLTKRLEERGFSVVHDKSVYDLIDGTLDRNKAYDVARPAIQKILQKYPSIEVVIDLHRDGVTEGLHLYTDVKGKKTAKIMFFNGLSRTKSAGEIDGIYNPYIKTNLALSLQLKLKALQYYPDFTRTNYLNAYKYNLDLRPKCLLVEAGAQTNTYEEEANAMEPLSNLLAMVLKP